MQDLYEILAATLSGVTVDEFKAEAKTWLETARHPRWKCSRPALSPWSLTRLTVLTVSWVRLSPMAVILMVRVPNRPSRPKTISIPSARRRRPDPLAGVWDSETTGIRAVAVFEVAAES